MKAALKTIIKQALAHDQGTHEDEDDEFTSRKGTTLLNYDLQILADHVKERNVKQVVLSIQDIEAFDSHLLSEVIELCGYWKNKIPFAFFISIATSIDFFQQRLSREAVKRMRGQLFDVAPAQQEIQRVFNVMVDPRTPLWIGPNVMRLALERQSDYVQSIDSLVQAMQYSYMSCYYANALSIFLDTELAFTDVPVDHFEALRNLPSFQSHCRLLLRENRAGSVRDMLDKDQVLFDETKRQVRDGQINIYLIVEAVDVFRDLQRILPNQQIASRSTLYIQAMSNKLAESSMIRSFLLSIRKAPSDIAGKIIERFIAWQSEGGEWETKCLPTQDQLEMLLRDQDDQSNPLRSEDDIKNSTLRTTVIAQKVELSKQKSTLSKQDAAYTELLRSFSTLLEEFFAERLIDPTSLPFHEIFLYDLKSPHREVFTPRPRHAIERALTAPYDYLACDCCTPAQGDSDEATLASSQPATAVLYQLYLESGSLINVHDLGQAFQAVMGDEWPEKQSMALFMRALSELKYLGLVKGTRKRADHVAKVAWKGL